MKTFIKAARMAMVRKFAAQNVGVVYISHRLDGIFEIGDRVTVLRDGRTVDSRPIAEMTRGIDVGAKAEVHMLLNKLASDGMSIIVVSSDLPEVLAISDRVLVLKEGRITGVLSRSETTQERPMRAATG